MDVHRADACEDDAPLCEVDAGVERDAVLEALVRRREEVPQVVGRCSGVSDLLRAERRGRVHNLAPCLASDVLNAIHPARYESEAGHLICHRPREGLCNLLRVGAIERGGANEPDGEGANAVNVACNDAVEACGRRRGPDRGRG